MKCINLQRIQLKKRWLLRNKWETSANRVQKEEPLRLATKILCAMGVCHRDLTSFKFSTTKINIFYNGARYTKIIENLKYICRNNRPQVGVRFFKHVTVKNIVKRISSGQRSQYLCGAAALKFYTNSLVFLRRSLGHRRAGWKDGDIQTQRMLVDDLLLLALSSLAVHS